MQWQWFCGAGPVGQLEDTFRRGERQLREVLYHVLGITFEACKDRLLRPSKSFLTTPRLLRYCAAIRVKGGLYNRVFGFIDGTVYQLSRPSGNLLWQRSLYNGHKRYHSLKWQGVCTPDGLIQFLQGVISCTSP